ncbi:MAG: DNA replication protein [Rhodobacteraceae bacterium HLUCCA12]|nr:MAG: DNA replication protein [Rhodobacteraceae bacterium HLUCCA12]
MGYDHLKLTALDCVIIDELGYIPFPKSGGSLLFHLISKLYETTSVIITEVVPEFWTIGIGGLSAKRRHDAASKGKTIATRPRQNDSPAFKEKVAMAAIKGEKALIEPAQDFDVQEIAVRQPPPWDYAAAPLRGWPRALLQNSDRKGFTL